MATKMQTQRQIVRHGDLVLHPVDKVPVKGLKSLPGTSLATGTATGHSHRFTPSAGAKLYDEGDGTMLLRVVKPVKLVHEEHADLKLAIGDWRVSHKRQYDRENGWTAVQD